MAKYRLKFMLDYYASCLWSVNDEAHRRFDYEVDRSELPLSQNLQCLLDLVEAYYNTCIDWETAPDKGPWWTDEDERILKQKARIAYEQVKKELGEEYEVSFDPRL